MTGSPRPTGLAVSSAVRLAVVAALQIAVLAWIAIDRVLLLTTGREIVLDVVPVDPRSLFRGDYVVLSYAASQIPTGLLRAPVRDGAAIYVTLTQNPGQGWVAKSAGPTYPSAIADDDVVLRGTAEYQISSPDGQGSVRVRYGLEAFFLPEGTGRELENMVGERRIAAVIAVGRSGTSGLKSLMVDGKIVERVPLI
jgi:uncharacterized membrane-anchored protein